MDIIALKGNSNQGKSETLNVVYQLMLLFGYTQVPGHFRLLGNPINRDCVDILEKNGVKIGIAIMGDYEKPTKYIPLEDTIQGLLEYLSKNGCSKAICACNNSLSKAIVFIEANSHIFIDKTITTIEGEQRIRNGNDAERIYKLI